MPALSRLLDKLSVAAPYVRPKEDPPETPTFTTYALWTVPRQPSRHTDRSPADARAQITRPALRSVARLSASEIPHGGVLYALTAPDPSADPRSSFLLDCLPDPLGWLAHCALFIRARLERDEGERIEWRHDQIELVFETQPGLAATSGGTIKVSMQWVGSLMAHVRDGGRSRASATREIKGVLLHELVHAIQYDGQLHARSTAPSWLIESIADFIRLQAHLGPPHWRKAGQGREERGWEDGYDAGARFFAWLEDWVDPSHGQASKWAEKERERVLAGVTIAARFGTVPKGRRLGAKNRPGTIRPSSGGSSSSGSGSGTRTPTQASISRQGDKEPLYVVLNDEDEPPIPETGEGISRTATPTQASTRRDHKGQSPHQAFAAAEKKNDGPWPGIISQMNQKLRREAYNEDWWAELTGVEGGLAVLWARYLGDYRV